MREMVALGKYYERDPTLLLNEVSAHYGGARGPGAEPLSKIVRNVRAIIAPNSPYKNCGDCMAWSYKEIAESPLPDVYVIIATNQNSQESGLTLTTYQSPLGIVRIDQELSKAVAEKGNIGFNDEIHARDAMIEVQLPFLQQAKHSEIGYIKILPILLSKGVDTKQLALDIKEALIELKRTAVFIVSTGFTHFGPLFHYVPFALEVEKSIHELDRSIFEPVLAQDADGFRQVIDEKMVRMHGSLAVELLLRILKPCNVQLECYYTSGDILGDYKNSVSYASIVFEEKEGAKAHVKEV